MDAPKETVTRARELRRKLTLPEVILWNALRGRRLEGWRFRRQHPLGPYILDFYCAEARLAVEIDGAAHDHPDKIEHDQRRTRCGLRMAASGCCAFRRARCSEIWTGCWLDCEMRLGRTEDSGEAATPPPPLRGPPPP